jgi:hypothetical protein
VPIERNLLTGRSALCAQEAARRAVQAFDAVARDDVGLHHHRHIFLQRPRQRPGRAAAPADDRREIARARRTRRQGEATKMTRAIPLDETPEDLVGTVSFLASEDAAFITGQTIVVDDGSAMI